MFNKGWTRIICVLLVLGLAPVALTGCFGSFAAWHKVKDFNEEASENKWMQELLFLVLYIIPVYGIAMLLDIIIINSIEFWTGENPMMDEGTSRTVIGEDGSVATITPVGQDRLEVTVVALDGTQSSFQLQRGENSITAYDAAGEVVAQAEMKDGQPQVVHGSR
jgi:hypothetical protein